MFPLHLRGTGESFAANIGGRVLGTAAAWLTITLSESSPPNPAKIALVGALVAGGYALMGAIATRWLPEPMPQELPHSPGVARTIASSQGSLPTRDKN